jgi:hypothetical protein
VNWKGKSLTLKRKKNDSDHPGTTEGSDPDSSEGGRGQEG